MTTLQDIEDWKRVAVDPTAIDQRPVKIQGIHPINENVIIRLLISREHAVDHFRNGLFAGLDLLVLSATCWDKKTERQIVVDEALFKAHLTKLLGAAHEFAAFPHNMGSPGVSYRLLLINEDQKPHIPTPLQMASLWGRTKH